MTGVLGLDINATKAGIALPTGRTVTLTAPRVDIARNGPGDIGRRLHWWHGAITRIARTYQPHLAVIENYALHSPGVLSTIRSAEVGGVVRDVLTQHSIPFAEIEPATLKQWAHGKGNADKAQMESAALNLGAHAANDDEADAWLLRIAGLVATGHHDGIPDRNHLLAKTRWPDLTDLAP